jgi:betaine lipid synthase
VASPGGNIASPEGDSKLVFIGLGLGLCSLIAFSRYFGILKKKDDDSPNLVQSFLVFAYSCFLKPHQGDGKGTQQDALESFYRTQKGIYDVTRKALLKGREDMLALAAAQLRFRAGAAAEAKETKQKRIWVDVRLITIYPSFLDIY